tara:strand:- start:773 stop:1780 length:1008 start_codon:yes stop_codon:yes gene_type:complete
MQEEYNKLYKIITGSKKNVVITTHRGPDGDAMGSSLALYHLLKKLEHNVQIITPNDYAYFLHWLPGNKDVIIYEESKEKCKKISEEADLIFFMDLNNIDRIADYKDCIINTSSIKILIDHHQDPDYSMADLVFSDTKSSSTAELLYNIIKVLNLNQLIDKDISQCLYTGILTDTGSFKYSSTTSITHDIISDLIERGVDHSRIHDLIYDNSSIDRMRLLGYCLNEKLQVYEENNSAIISLNHEELTKFNFKKGDTEGIINYALAIKGIIFAAFIVEKDGITKLSLRSKGNFKVNEIAKKYFNGGGHINASGGVSQLSVKETIKKLEYIIKKIKIK